MSTYIAYSQNTRNPLGVDCAQSVDSAVARENDATTDPLPEPRPQQSARDAEGMLSDTSEAPPPIKLSSAPTRKERADKIWDECLAEFIERARRLRLHHDYVARKLDSDLERMMYAALYFLDSELVCCYGVGPSSNWRQELFLDVHKQVGPYTVDFALTVPAKIAFDDEEIRIAIECDGFYFHDRTPKQAEHDKKRDRYLALHGWRVVRFAEAEIVRDARACAQQVIEFVDSLLHEQISRGMERDDRRARP